MHHHQAPSPRLSPEPWLAEEPARILLLPGLNDCGPGHWQSRWDRLSGFRRVELGDWQRPKLHLWVERLDRAIRESPRRVVFAGHNLGCLAVAWWAALNRSEALFDKVQGALLVAPPDVDAIDTCIGVRDFRPAPDIRFPFTAFLIGSRNDPQASYRRSTQLARNWGCSLVDAGPAGQLDDKAGLGAWPTGLRLIAQLSGHDPAALVARVTSRFSNVRRAQETAA